MASIKDTLKAIIGVTGQKKNKFSSEKNKMGKKKAKVSANKTPKKVSSNTKKPVKSKAKAKAKAKADQPKKAATKSKKPQKIKKIKPVKEAGKKTKKVKEIKQAVEVKELGAAVEVPAPIEEQVAKELKPNKVKGSKKVLDKAKKETKAVSGPLNAPLTNLSSASPKEAAMQAAAKKESICREPGCSSVARMFHCCRLHYIKNWQKIKRKELILREKHLNRYIEELVAKYPDKYIEAIRNDLANDSEFEKVIMDLEIDENFDDIDYDADSVDSLIENIRRDFDEDEFS